MQHLVIKPENRIIIDGEAHDIDLSDLPDNIQVIQWHDDVGRGWVEYATAADGSRQGNTTLDSFDDYEHLIDRWNVAKADKARSDAEEYQEKEAIRLQQEAESQAAIEAAIEAGNAAVAQRESRIDALEARIAALELKVR